VVFSTLHTNDALGAIPRLLDLGVPPYLVTTTLEAVLAQRLVRRICEECREPYVLEPATVALLDEGGDLPGTLTRGRGCAACHGTGYRGRTGLFELLVLTDELRAAIVAEPSRRSLEQVAREGGMRSLRADGWTKVAAGVTTVEEVLRVTQN